MQGCVKMIGISIFDVNFELKSFHQIFENGEIFMSWKLNQNTVNHCKFSAKFCHLCSLLQQASYALNKQRVVLGFGPQTKVGKVGNMSCRASMETLLFFFCLVTVRLYMYQR